jgi:hypothetical protein|tara:strand:+ start:5331 stop:5567 length:237 start_codon:yes stop_codon:yes gene_type:complete
MKAPIITVKDNKICVNGMVFEHNELRELKEYLQKTGAQEALYNPSDDDEAELLEEIILKMAEMTPEAAGQDIPSYYLN